jgi:hypothetical protein
MDQRTRELVGPLVEWCADQQITQNINSPSKRRPCQPVDVESFAQNGYFRLEKAADDLSKTISASALLSEATKESVKAVVGVLGFMGVSSGLNRPDWTADRGKIVIAATMSGLAGFTATAIQKARTARARAATRRVYTKLLDRGRLQWIPLPLAREATAQNPLQSSKNHVICVLLLAS